MKKYILNLLTCGLYSQVKVLQDTNARFNQRVLDVLESDESIVTTAKVDVMIDDFHRDEIQGEYMRSNDFEPSDYDLVLNGDYNFDDFITADDVSDEIDYDSIAEKAVSNYDLVSNDTVKDMIDSACADYTNFVDEDTVKDMIDEIEKPQQVSINDVIEQLVNQTETYKGMHLKYEVQITEYKRKIAELESK